MPTEATPETTVKALTEAVPSDNLRRTQGVRMDATMAMQIINLLGICALGWLIYTLKNAVNAQKNTIDAHKTHIEHGEHREHVGCSCNGGALLRHSRS